MARPTNRIIRERVVRGFAAALGAVMLITACSGGTTAGTPVPTGALAHDAEVLRGRTIFAEQCATCHGDAGGGGVGPSFHDEKLLNDFPTVAAQIAFVKRGRGIMPAWAGKLTEAQIRAVVRYEREVLSPLK